MNAKRRKVIAGICATLEALHDEIETVKDDEEESYGNMPENLQGSERGMESEECIQMLDDALESISNAICALGDM